MTFLIFYLLIFLLWLYLDLRYLQPHDLLIGSSRFSTNLGKTTAAVIRSVIWPISFFVLIGSVVVMMLEDEGR